eukprot:scaffold52913_cov62-Phaeocystis_antarctica.AAC.2
MRGDASTMRDALCEGACGGERGAAAAAARRCTAEVHVAAMPWRAFGRQKVHAENEVVTELEGGSKTKLLGLKLLGLKRRGVIPTTSALPPVAKQWVSVRVCDPNQTGSGKCTPLGARRSRLPLPIYHARSLS